VPESEFEAFAKDRLNDEMIPLAGNVTEAKIWKGFQCETGAAGSQ